MSGLSDFRKKNSNFLTLADGETVKGEYLGYKITPSPFDPEREVVLYYLEVEGQKKIFRSSSNKAAEFFEKIKKLQKVVIKRLGTGRDTQYDFQRGDPKEVDENDTELSDEEGDNEEKVDPDDIPF